MKRVAWPELVGRNGTDAVQYIKEKTGKYIFLIDRRRFLISCLGFTNVVIIPDGSMVTMDFRMDRVRVFVDKDGIVVRTPRTG